MPPAQRLPLRHDDGPHTGRTPRRSPAGRRGEATYANPLGLHAEEICHGGEQLSVFAEAFTHLTLISAAFNLDRALG
ncbi:hypothetical protein RPQ07_36950 [Streptomyces sp. AM8-1-1]|nr:hypothetical protein [Streptomyces sp. AM8-1-1]WNO77426.1 hypothetical protein RPQ07_36950 [Streptomyces sp. AM8-1-1]